MTSKDVILQNIRRNRPSKTSLPDIPDFKGAENDLTENFQRALKSNSGDSIILSSADDIGRLISEQYPNATQICSLVAQVVGNVDHASVTDPHSFKDLDLVVLQAELGVAENAAMWLTEKTLAHRVIPFITQHLIIIISKKDLVAKMHDAYKKIRIDETGYGVFIAGPSKTADIEQTLVVGAHGARSLLVIIVE